MRAHDPASGPRRPELGALSTNRALAVPFLPTLATAVVIASLSLLCRQPSAPEPAADPVVVSGASVTSADMFQRPVEAPDPATVIPAAITFGQLYPLTPPDGASAASRQSPARLAAATRRGAKRGEAVRSAAIPARTQPEPAPLPFREADDRGGEGLPESALPFAPTAAMVVDTVRALGSDATALGGSVMGSVALMR